MLLNRRCRFAKSIFVLAVTLCSVWSGSVASAASTFNANTDYDAGFSAGANPNGVWTYGWSSTPTTALTVYSRHHLLATGNNLFQGWDDPNNNVQFTPLVYKNSGSSFSDGNIDIPAGALILHGGGSSTHDYSHVLFTTATTGSYSLSTSFIGRQVNVNADFFVLDNGVSLFQGVVNADRDTHSFSTTLSLQAGDKIDFVVGENNLGLHPGSVELQATLGPAVVPEPASLILLATGIAAVLGAARRIPASSSLV